MKKRTLITLATVVIVGAGLLTTQAVNAFYSNKGGTFSGVIQALVDRFNLDPDEVQIVVDEYREDMHQQMTQTFEDRLNDAVDNGGITPEQKQLILEKHEQMMSDKENFSNLSEEEQREMKLTYHEDLEAWAEENGINLRLIMPGQAFHKGYVKGFRHGMHMDGWK